MDFQLPIQHFYWLQCLLPLPKPTERYGLRDWTKSSFPNISWFLIFLFFSYFLFSSSHFYSLELNITFVPPLYIIFHISLKQIAVYLKICKRRIVIIIYQQDHSQANVVNPIVTSDRRSRTGKNQGRMLIF